MTAARHARFSVANVSIPVVHSGINDNIAAPAPDAVPSVVQVAATEQLASPVPVAEPNSTTTPVTNVSMSKIFVRSIVFLHVARLGGNPLED